MHAAKIVTSVVYCTCEHTAVSQGVQIMGDQVTRISDDTCWCPKTFSAGL
jgi:hypothetical protein